MVLVGPSSSCFSGIWMEFLAFLFSFIDFSWSLGEAFAYSLLGVQVRFQPEVKK